MSPRHFSRAFARETGVSPARAVERLRLEAARALIETGGDPIESVAGRVGFGDPERMRRAFSRGFGHPPRALRRAARSRKSAAPCFSPMTMTERRLSANVARQSKTLGGMF